MGLLETFVRPLAPQVFPFGAAGFLVQAAVDRRRLLLRQVGDGRVDYRRALADMRTTNVYSGRSGR